MKPFGASPHAVGTAALGSPACIGHDFAVSQVGVGWHRLYQYVCVVTLGGSFRDKPRPLQQTVHERFIQVMIGNKDKDVVIAA